VVAAAGALASGCGGPGALRVEVTRPPVLPVRVFPVVYLAVDEGDLDAVEIERALAEALARPPRVTVRRTSPAALAARRAAVAAGDRAASRPADSAAEPSAVRSWAASASEGIERVSCVIRISVRVEEVVRPDWRTRSTPVCTAGGCFPGSRGMGLDFLQMTVRLRLRVEDGPSGRTLQEHTLEARDEGSDAFSMRARLALELAERARGLVDRSTVRAELPLVAVGDPRADAWLARARDGRVGEARRAFDALVRAPDFARRPLAERAALLHDLGQLVRADTALGPERHAAAVPILERALALDAAPVHAQAVRDAREAAEGQALLAEQAAARAHNAALLRRARAPEAALSTDDHVPSGAVHPSLPPAPPPHVPPPPPSYRDARPEAGP
jgi:hypothetical protein